MSEQSIMGWFEGPLIYGVGIIFGWSCKNRPDFLIVGWLIYVVIMYLARG